MRKKRPVAASAADQSTRNAPNSEPRKDEPRRLLLPYQDCYAYDPARWKFALQARQTGKDFASNHEIVVDCMQHDQKKKKVDWLIAAPSERQSVESLGKARDWCEIYKIALAGYSEEREGGSEGLLKSATISFPQGSRIIAVPGRPDTVRGFSANLLLTEFAFFEDSDATWRAVLPSVTNPIRGGVKKVRLVTTPNGIGNKAHDLWSKNYGTPGANWSCHRVDIYEAVRQGLPLDPEEIRAGLDDAEGWAQEYLLEFMDAQSTLLPYELIATCESAEASESVGTDYWASPGAAPVFLGIDFGRRRDLTVCWAAAVMGDVLHTREVLCLTNTSTPDQVAQLRPRLRCAKRVCLDYTGAGIGLGDYLVKEFGQYDPERDQFGKIELVTFTQQKKVEIFSKLKMGFERARLRVPTSRVIREDLHSVNRVAMQGGGVTYRAPHNADGHADRCTALGLCVRAWSDGGIHCQGAPVGGHRPTAGDFGMGRVSQEVAL